MTDTLAHAKTAQDVLRACWILVSAGHRDAVAGDVERMRKALGAAIEAEDLAGCSRLVPAFLVSCGSRWQQQLAQIDHNIDCSTVGLTMANACVPIASDPNAD